jgi:hypothetical protein
VRHPAPPIARPGRCAHDEEGYNVEFGTYVATTVSPIVVASIAAQKVV